MKSITLRDLPEGLASRIRERARKNGTSLNRTVIDMLTQAECPAKTRIHHDLDFLIGTWSAEEADEFDRALSEQRTVDPELWK